MFDYKIWHKDLIKVLPDNLLTILYQNLSDYACNPIVSKRVNPYKYKMNEYNKSHFYNYCCEVFDELNKRDLDEAMITIIDGYSNIIYCFVTPEEKQIGSSISHEELFKGWHGYKYIVQCFYALEELCDYGLIDEKVINEAKEVIIKNYGKNR